MPATGMGVSRAALSSETDGMGTKSQAQIGMGNSYGSSAFNGNKMSQANIMSGSMGRQQYSGSGTQSRIQVGAASQNAYGFNATSGQGAPTGGISSMMQNNNNASRGLGVSASSTSMYRTERTNPQGQASGSYEEMMGNNNDNSRTLGRESSFGAGPPGG